MQLNWMITGTVAQTTEPQMTVAAQPETDYPMSVILWTAVRMTSKRKLSKTEHQMMLPLTA